MTENNCSQHKKEVAGISDMKVLAEMIGDLHYQTLHKLFTLLWLKFDLDAKNDLKNGKIKLGCKLMDVRLKVFSAAEEIKELWQISKPFMNQK